MIKRPSLGYVLFIIAVVWASAAAADTGPAASRGVLRIRDGRIISFAQMIREVKKADLVFVGEVHDRREHHRAELDVVRALHGADVPVAVGLEMFRADSQGALDAWVTGKLPATDFIAVYLDNWRMPWSFYDDIFWYAREHGIPLVGLNISNVISRKVAQTGFSSLSGEERKQLPPGISCNVDPKYMAFIRKAYAGHGLSGRSFVNFCEAQMVWDKSMAWHLIDYHKRNPGKAIVVLAGVGHSWKRGIPEQVSMETRLTSRVILPLIPGQIDRRTVTIKDADYVLLYE